MLDAVIDIFGPHDRNPDYVQARDSGHIAAVMYQSTTGTTTLDGTYENNRVKALAAGLYWGASHVGIRGDGSDQYGEDQAKYFMEKVFHNSDAEAALAFLALDHRGQRRAGSEAMTLNQVRKFMEYMYTHRSDVALISDDLIKSQLGNQPPDPVLSRNPLWIVQHGDKLSQPTNIPPTWASWAFWEYSGGEIPDRVPGIGSCARVRFNGGSVGELEIVWLGEAK